MFPSTRKKCHVWRCLFASLIVGLLWKSLYTVVTKCLLLRLDTVCCVTEEVSLFGCCSRFDLARNLITLEHSTCTLSPTPLHLVTLNIHRKSSGSVIMVFFGLKFKKFRECSRWQSLRKGERVEHPQLNLSEVIQFQRETRSTFTLIPSYHVLLFNLNSELNLFRQKKNIFLVEIEGISW